VYKYAYHNIYPGSENISSKYSRVGRFGTSTNYSLVPAGTKITSKFEYKYANSDGPGGPFGRVHYQLNISFDPLVAAPSGAEMDASKRSFS
jgi:hypothetical protein